MIDQLYIGYLAAISGLNTDSLPKTPADGSALKTILGIVIATVAAVSLLFIVIGAVKYILSRGDPQAIASAKNTILYAIVGLIIAILAQAIVVFVLKGATS